MPSVTESITVEAPVERVWEVVSDLSRYGEWLDIHKSFPEGTPETLEEGSTVRQLVSVGGMPADITWTITALDEHERFELTGAGPMGVSLRSEWRVSAEGDSTTISMTTEFSGGPLAGPMGDMLAAQAGKAAAASLEKLAALI